MIYKFIENIYMTLPGEEAGLLAAMVVGDKSGLGKEMYENLKNTGLIHLVVVSGSNVMLIVSSLIENLAGWLGRKWAIMIGLMVGWGYVGVVGWEAPVMRAILLISIYYWAQILGRKYNLVRGLGLAVVIMAVADWGIVMSVSFWLSVMAFAGVVTTKSKNDLMRTVWVGVWVTPILAMVFGKISLVAPFSNVMVLGTVEMITVVGIIGMIINRWLLWLVYPLLRYFVWVVRGMGNLAWASIEIKFNWWMLVGWYLVLVYFLIKRWEKGNR